MRVYNKDLKEAFGASLGAYVKRMQDLCQGCLVFITAISRLSCLHKAQIHSRMFIYYIEQGCLGTITIWTLQGDAQD